MWVRIRDSETGRTALAEGSVWYWTEGNGRCDCNRALVFGDDPPRPYCRSVRYRIVDAGGDLGGDTPEEFLAAANATYRSTV